MTTFKVGTIPLLPHELGQKERFDFLFSLSNASNSFLILNYYHIKSFDLNDTYFSNLNMKEIQRALKIDGNNIVELRVGFVIQDAYSVKFSTKFEDKGIETMSIILQITLF